MRPTYELVRPTYEWLERLSSSDTSFERAPVRKLRRGYVLDRHAKRFEYRNLLVGPTAAYPAEDQLAKLARDVIGREAALRDAQHHIAGLSQRARAGVDEQSRARGELRCDFALIGPTCADRDDVRSRSHPCFLEHRRRRRGGKHDQIGASHGLFCACRRENRRMLRLCDEPFPAGNLRAPEAHLSQRADPGIRLQVTAGLHNGAEDSASR